MHGAQIFEHCSVNKILTKNGSIEGVDTKHGKIKCEYIVLASGMWLSLIHISEPTRR